MTDLTSDQLIDVAAGVGTKLKPGEATGWTALDLFQSVVMTVAYLRQDATETFLAAIFDVSQSTISRRRTRLEALVTAALEDLRPDPDAVRGDPVIVDGTLVPTSDWAHPNDLFSGKHHRPGMNVQVAVTCGGTLLALGAPAHGARHDAHAWRESGLAGRFPGSQLIGDLGYVGVEGFTTGTRRRPGQQLTDRERSANQSLNSVRAVVERTIAHVKNWKVLKYYRGPLNTFDRTLHCVEALYRLEHSHRRHPET